MEELVYEARIHFPLHPAHCLSDKKPENLLVALEVLLDLRGIRLQHLPDDSLDRPLIGNLQEASLTHDLLCSVLKSLGGTLNRVIITRVQKSTYYAELIVHRNGDVYSLDARPSDSIAVALRVDARIVADDALPEVASIEIADEEIASGGAGGQQRLEVIDPDASMDAEELKEYLRGLDPEDFGRFTP